MSAPDLRKIEKIGAVVLLLFVLVSWILVSEDFTLGVTLGGILALINFRVVSVLLGKLVQGGTNSAWVILPLVGKSGLLAGLILLLGLWFKVDMMGLALGFSSIVLGVAMLASLKLIQPLEQE